MKETFEPGDKVIFARCRAHHLRMGLALCECRRLGEIMYVERVYPSDYHLTYNIQVTKNPYTGNGDLVAPQQLIRVDDDTD